MSQKPEATYTAANGERIDLYRAGENDYWAYFHDSDYSVRGDLIDVMREIIESVDTPAAKGIELIYKISRSKDKAYIAYGPETEVIALAEIPATLRSLIKAYTDPKFSVKVESEDYTG